MSARVPGHHLQVIKPLRLAWLMLVLAGQLPNGNRRISMPGERRPAGVLKVGRCRLFPRTDVMTWIGARQPVQKGPSAA